MKKIMSWVLLVAMLLGMFAGCGKSQDPTQPSTDPVEIPEVTVTGENNALDVVNYLQAIYKDSGAKTAGNFERFGIVRIAGVPYEVVWTADVGEDLVKIIVNDDGTVTIDVNEKCPEDTIYVLTATITDANGNTETASWEYLLPGTASLEEMHATIDEAYALEKGEALTEERVLTGVIKSIDTPYSDQYKNITVTIQVEGREDKPIMCYRLKGEGAAELNPGDTITVQGLLKNYNGTIEFDAGCQLTSVEKTGTPVVIPTDHHQILQDVYALGDNESLPYGPITLTGRICAIDTPYSEQYKNITVSIIIDWYTIKCYRLKGEGAESLEMNDIITVKGYIKKYNGTREFEMPELLEVVKVGEVPQPASQLQVAKVAYGLDPGWTVPYGDVTLTGTITKVNSSWSSKYENITVTFTVDGDTKGEYPIECYRMVVGEDASKELKEAIKKLDVGDKITVKGILMKYQFVPSGDTKVELNVPELLAVTKAPKEDSGLTATLTTSLKTGDKVVIVAPEQKMAMSSVIVNNYYPKGVEVEISGNTISGFAATEVMTVTVNGDGSYTFSYGGKNLGMASKYASMYFGNPNDDWSLSSVSTGVYNVKNTVRGNYMQFATQYSTWQTSSSVPTDKSGNLSFYKFEGELPGEEESTENVYMTSAPKNGDKVVIVAAKYGKALSTTKVSTYYNAGVDVTASNGKLTGYADSEVWTVIVNEDGSYSFENGGSKIAMQASNSSMMQGAVNDKWNVNALGDGLFNIVNIGRSGMAMEWYSSKGNFSTYYKNITTDDQFFMAFYLVEAAKEPSPYMTEAPKNGDEVVIVAANYNKALSTTKVSTYYNAGVDVVSANGKLSGYSDSEIWTVIVNDDGSYSFENGGSKIAMQASNSSMMQGAVNDKWKVNALGDGLFNIVNIGRSGMAMEWYSSKGNFSTYYKNITTDDQFFMAFYLVEAGSGTVDPEEPTVTEGTIAEALDAAEGTQYKVKGVVTMKEVTDTSTNLYIQDSTGAICVRVSGTADVELGDTIIATGSRASYNGLPQLGSATYEKSSGMTLTAEKTILDDLYEGFLCKYIAVEGLKVTAINGTNVDLIDNVDVEIQLYKGVFPSELKVGDVINFTGALGVYNDTWQLRNTLASEIVIVSSSEEGGDDNTDTETPAEPTTVTVIISEFADANGWKDATRYAELKMDDNVTITLTNTGSYNNTGKYYINGENWRIYQNENPAVTFTAANGKKIVSVKITYAVNKNGVLTLNGSNVSSGTAVEVNAASVTFGVGNTGTETKGQVRITAIEVVYQ